jgi:hypothetical protein
LGGNGCKRQGARNHTYDFRHRKSETARRDSKIFLCKIWELIEVYEVPKATELLRLELTAPHVLCGANLQQDANQSTPAISIHFNGFKNNV